MLLQRLSHNFFGYVGWCKIWASLSPQILLSRVSFKFLAMTSSTNRLSISKIDYHLFRHHFLEASSNFIRLPLINSLLKSSLSHTPSVWSGAETLKFGSFHPLWVRGVVSVLSVLGRPSLLLGSPYCHTFYCTILSCYIVFCLTFLFFAKLSCYIVNSSCWLFIYKALTIQYYNLNCQW